MLTTIGDLFDEADFMATATGLNPDEIVLDDPPKEEEPAQRQMPPPQQRPQENFARPPARPSADVVTPSKPANTWTAGAQRQLPQHNQAAGARQNTPATTPQQPLMQRRPSLASMPQQPPPQNTKPAHQTQSRSSQDAPPSHASGGQAAVKQEPPNNHNNPMNNAAQSNDTQDSHPPGSSPTPGNNQPENPPSVFYSAKAVDILRENPQAAASAPQFNPHAESPSIRKTAGVDHTKSLPITKPMLAGVSPAANNTRDFINPSSEMHRRIGAPGGGSGGGFGSPMGRGQSTSSFRPLTRPNIDPRNAGNNNAAGPNNRGPPGPQNANGKRPPLGDVTNAPPGAAGNGATTSTSGPGDPKRPRISSDGNNSMSLPQQQQQQQQQPQQQPHR